MFFLVPIQLSELFWDRKISKNSVTSRKKVHGGRQDEKFIFLIWGKQILYISKALRSNNPIYLSQFSVLVAQSCPRLFAISWTVACQALLSMAFSRQEYRSGLPWPSPGDLSHPGIEPGSPALQAVFTIWATREALTPKGIVLKSRFWFSRSEDGRWAAGDLASLVSAQALLLLPPDHPLRSQVLEQWFITLTACLNHQKPC